MIIIHSAGNSKIGIGHLSRVRSLALELMKYNVEVAMVVEAEEELIKNTVNLENVFHATNRSNANGLIKKILSRTSKLNKNVYVTDLLELSIEQRKFAIDEGFSLRVHLNDSNLEQYEPDVWVNGDAFRNSEEEYIAIPERLVGPAFAILNEETVQARPKDFKFTHDNISRLLISFGGADPGRYTEFFIQNVCTQYKDLNFNIVIGPAFSSDRINNLLSLQKSVSNVALIEKPKGINQLILDADALISLGGISAYEAMCIGKPVLAVEWESMSSYVRKLDEAGFITSLGTIHEAIQKLSLVISNIGELERKAKYAWKCVDGRGAERIAKYLVDYLEG